MFGSNNATFIISNKEMNGIMKIVKSLEETRLLNKALVKQLKMMQKNKKGGFYGMLLGTLRTSLLGNLWTSNDTVRGSERRIRADQDF